MQEVVLSVVDNLKGYFYRIRKEDVTLMLIHCRNSLCKYYWEDSCTIILENKLVALDENGKCEEQEEGISDYYKEG